MPVTTYTYDITNDTANGRVNAVDLEDEINNASLGSTVLRLDSSDSTIDGVVLDGGTLNVVMQDAVTTASLDAVVAAHQGSLEKELNDNTDQLENVSSVSGATVTNALNNLDSTKSSILHADGHIKDGYDEIDGDQLDIDFTPSNYTPDTSPAEVTDADHLSAHLAGIDSALSSAGTDISVEDDNSQIISALSTLNFGTRLDVTDDGGGQVTVDADINGLITDARQVVAGAGLTGGGDLSADRTLDVVANADGSIVVNANDIQVGVLANDSQHGDLGGGSLHAESTTTVAGFLSATDKTKLDSIESGAEVNDVDSVFGRTGAVVAVASDYDANQIDFTPNGDIAATDVQAAIVEVRDDTDTKLTGKVETLTQIIAGDGLTGGGNLSTDRTLDVVANADGSIIVNANDIQVGVLANDSQHGDLGGGSLHANATTTVAGFLSATDKTKLDGIEAGAEVNTVDSVFGRTGAVTAQTSDYDANQIDFTPNGDISATDVQAAIVEVRDDTDTKLTGKADVTHAATHILGGSDEIDGDQLDIDFTPSNYTPDTSPAEATNVDHLSAHLAGIDSALASAGTDISVEDDSSQIISALSTLNFGTRLDVTDDGGGQVTIDVDASGVVLDTTQIIAGDGLTGGGDLSTDRTLDVVANADGSIVVNANDIQVGVLASDSQHGDLGGGSLHAEATTTVAGFLSASDKTKLDGVEAGAEVNTVDSVFGRTGAVTAQTSDYDANQIDFTPNADITSTDVQAAIVEVRDDTDTKLTGKTDTSTQIIAGNGLTGGGDLSTDRTLDVVANADGSIIVNANDIQVGVLANDSQHGDLGGGSLHADATTTVAGFLSATDKTKLNGIEDNAKDDQDADEVPYDNTTSGLVATDVQAALDELVFGQSEFLFLYDATGGLTVPGGGVAIPWDTQSKITSAFSHTAPSSEVTIQRADTYIVRADISIDAGSGTRSSSKSVIQLDTGSGFADVLGTDGWGYHRNNGNGDDTASLMAVLDLEVGDKIRIISSEVNGASLSTLAQGSRLIIFSPRGPQGPTGAGSNINVFDEGSVVPNGPHDTINFVGPGIAATDAGSAQADVTLTTATAVTITPEAGNQEGSANSLARSDHVHNIPTATAVDIEAGGTSSEGGSSSFARANHIHRIVDPSTEVSATAQTSTTSGAPVLISGMTITPGAGTYLVFFSSHGLHSNNFSQGVVTIFANGVSQDQSITFFGGTQFSDQTRIPVSCQCKVTIGTGQDIEARYRVNGGGSVTIYERSLIIIKVDT